VVRVDEVRRRGQLISDPKVIDKRERFYVGCQLDFFSFRKMKFKWPLVMTRFECGAIDDSPQVLEQSLCLSGFTIVYLLCRAKPRPHLSLYRVSDVGAALSCKLQFERFQKDLPCVLKVDDSTDRITVGVVDTCRCDIDSIVAFSEHRLPGDKHREQSLKI